uniref:Cysteine-rich secretory protein LCCL domain containing 2 n=1 Tax=Eptatretus burgeri TaxID=7764 RepID=A0A8C4N7X2_EPTBU
MKILHVRLHRGRHSVSGTMVLRRCFPPLVKTWLCIGAGRVHPSSMCRLGLMKPQTSSSRTHKTANHGVLTIVKDLFVRTTRRGNWIGLAPYKRGSRCSQCPPIYGGRCDNNLCYRGDKSIAENSDHKTPMPENSKDRDKPHKPHQTKPSKKVISTNKLVQEVTCETRLRDKCKGIKCRRYKCPANCLESNAKVFGSVFYYMFSSICRAAIHHGVVNNGGGLVDVTLQGKKPFFIRSSRHGVDSYSHLKAAKAFSTSPMSVQTIDCRTTVAQLCPFEKKITHCPRVYCQPRCSRADRAPVFGNKVYADSSSICRAALHAGVIADTKGGYVDVVPLREKKRYAGTFHNGIKSQRITNPSGGKAFRVFVVS